MSARTRMKAALSIAREGSPSRARASKFGWSEADLARRQQLWDWAMRVLERRSCGARRRRDGKPCQALNEPGRKRCRWHGGLSTGPRTVGGKARSLQNLRQYRQNVPAAMVPDSPAEEPKKNPAGTRQ